MRGYCRRRMARRVRVTLLLALAAAAVLWEPVGTAPAKKGAPPKKSAAGADRSTGLVDAMLRAYRRLEAFEETTQQTMEATAGTARQRSTFSTRFVYRKPNRFLYRLSDPKPRVTLTSNGTTLWVYSASRRHYTEQSAPGEMRDLEVLISHWAPPFLDALAILQSETPFGLVSDTRYVGAGRVDGEAVEIVELTGAPKELPIPDSRMRLFIGKKDRLLRKYEIRGTRHSAPTNPRVRPSSMAMAVTRTYRLRQFRKPLPPDTFVFRPPAGASRVDALDHR